MKCPKCQYISFDSGDRCRNCGYDFSLSLDRTPIELPIQDGTEPLGPMSDLTLNDLEASPPSASTETADTPPHAPPAPITASFELPLFKGPADADAPLVAPGAAPRAPLSVRRGAPAAPRPRTGGANRPARRPHEVPEEPRLALDTAEMPVVPEPRPEPPVRERREATAVVGAPPGARVVAGLIDIAILLGIDAGVVYFTLKVCDLSFAEIRALPMAPVAAFLLLLNGGYFAAFIAAAGQTIGKMGTGLRVIPGDPGAPPTERVSLGHAIVRAAAYLVSALPAGLGFLPVLVGHDGRALHDRLADTRVVKS